MGRGATGRGRWRAGKGQEWEMRGRQGGWIRRSGVCGGDRRGAMGRRLEGGWRGSNLKGEWGGGQQDGGDWRRGQRGGGEEGARGGGILQMDMMECYRIPANTKHFSNIFVKVYLG